MEFIRARTSEQKEVRLTEIKNAARKLYETTPFSKITLSKIAASLPFDRANLYKYYSSKEEIYLQILVDEYLRYQDELANRIQDIRNENHFCQVCADTTYSYPVLIGLYTIWASTLEPMVPVEVAAAAVGTISEHGKTLNSAVQKVLTDFSFEEVRQLMWYKMRFISGMSNRITGGDRHNAAIIAAGVTPMQIDYRDALSKFLRVVIAGIRVCRSSGEKAIDSAQG